MTKLTDLTVKHLSPPEKGQRIVFDDALKGFGIRLSQGGTKTWVLVQGKDRKLTTLGRYPELGLGEARKRAVVAQDTRNAPKPTSTYADARTAFLRATARRVKLATQKQYEYYLDRIELKSLTPTKAEVNTTIGVFDKTPIAQNYAFTVLRNFLNWCLSEGLTTSHPLLRARLPNKAQSRDRVLNEEELRAIWHSASKTKFGTLVRLLILTGLRRSELIRAEDTGNTLVVKDTKNGTTHTLPITPLIREHLPIRPKSGNWSGSKKSFDERCPIAHWRIHDLRRTLATNMQMLGVGEHIIERVLNHTTGGVKGIYQRYRYAPEVEEALLTYHAYIAKITSPGYNTRATGGSISGVTSENPQQARATPQDHRINTTHHSTGEIGQVSETSPVDPKQSGVAGE